MTMVLLDERVSRTLDQSIRQVETGALRGAHVDAWLFEGMAQRRAGNVRLAKAGVRGGGSDTVAQLPL
jgi:hypothetical protein